MRRMSAQEKGVGEVLSITATHWNRQFLPDSGKVLIIRHAEHDNLPNYRYFHKIRQLEHKPVPDFSRYEKIRQAAVLQLPDFTLYRRIRQIAAFSAFLGMRCGWVL